VLAYPDSATMSLSSGRSRNCLQLQVPRPSSIRLTNRRPKQVKVRRVLRLPSSEAHQRGNAIGVTVDTEQHLHVDGAPQEAIKPSATGKWVSPISPIHTAVRFCGTAQPSMRSKLCLEPGSLQLANPHSFHFAAASLTCFEKEYGTAGSRGIVERYCSFLKTSFFSWVGTIMRAMRAVEAHRHRARQACLRCVRAEGKTSNCVTEI
jgi:hypothetical protein